MMAPIWGLEKTVTLAMALSLPEAWKLVPSILSPGVL